MASIEQLAATVAEAVEDSARRFRFRAELLDGRIVHVPMVYQLEAVGFRSPYQKAKASPEELQERFDEVVALAAESGEELGLETEESVTKMATSYGWGVDCSNLASRIEVDVFDRLSLPSYISQVFRSTDTFKKLYEDPTKTFWQPKDESGGPRDLTDEEREILYNGGTASVEWLSALFGFDPIFNIGSEHMADRSAAVPVDSLDVLPGDILSFIDARKDEVTHVGVVSNVVHKPEITSVNFWHSWHQRGFDSRVRKDLVGVIDKTGDLVFNVPGLHDRTRYGSHEFVRPIALAALYESVGELEVLPN